MIDYLQGVLAFLAIAVCAGSVQAADAPTAGAAYLPYNAVDTVQYATFPAYTSDTASEAELTDDESDDHDAGSADDDGNDMSSGDDDAQSNDSASENDDNSDASDKDDNGSSSDNGDEDED